MEREIIENLANAIVLQACTDYRYALKQHDEMAIVKLEEFFHSDWYKMLTNVNGDYLINELRKKQRSRCKEK